MATLRIINSRDDCVEEALTPQKFVDFKKRCAEEGLGWAALIVKLDCGEEIFMDTCRRFRRLPRGACYTARLLKKPTSVAEDLEAKGHDVWVEA